jgi:hypothetical protein
LYAKGVGVVAVWRPTEKKGLRSEKQAWATATVSTLLK